MFFKDNNNIDFEYDHFTKSVTMFTDYYISIKFDDYINDIGETITTNLADFYNPYMYTQLLKSLINLQKNVRLHMSNKKTYKRILYDTVDINSLFDLVNDYNVYSIVDTYKLKYNNITYTIDKSKYSNIMRSNLFINRNHYRFYNPYISLYVLHTLCPQYVLLYDSIISNITFSKDCKKEKVVFVTEHY